MARAEQWREVVTNAQADDAIPELLPDDLPTKQTVELCAHLHDRARCMRKKGHDGQHESLALEGPQRWW